MTNPARERPIGNRVNTPAVHNPALMGNKIQNERTGSQPRTPASNMLHMTQQFLP